MNPSLPSDQELDRIRQSNMGRLLDQVHILFDKRAMDYLHQKGYPMVTAAHGHLFRTMRFEGARITDMARQANISKQAMSKLVMAFVDYGFLQWDYDPRDRRNRLVTVTDDGRKLLADSVVALKQAEEDLAAALGADDLEYLRTLLVRANASDALHASSPSPTYRRRRA